MGKYYWALRYYREVSFEMNFWGIDSRWPCPNSFRPRLFVSKDDAEEFLFLQSRMGRDVKKWRPFRIHVAKNKIPEGWKWIGGK